MARNDAIVAAKEEIEKHGATYRIKECRDHTQFYINGSPMIVTVTRNHASMDVRICRNVRRDIRKSISMINGAK